MTARLANRNIQKPCSSLWKVWAKVTGNKCIFIQKASEYQPCDICNNGEKNLIFHKCHSTRYLASNILPFHTPSSDSWAERSSSSGCFGLYITGIDSRWAVCQIVDSRWDWLPNLSINMLPNHAPPWIKTHFNQCYRTG